MIKAALSYATISYQEPIVYFEYKEGVELGFPEIRQLISHAEELSGNKPYVTLSDIRLNLNITNEGKRYVSDINNMPLFRGTAILVQNDLYKIALNFIQSLNKPHYPFRAFTDKQKAVEWLSGLPLNP
jgi:hypothetical protein